MRNVNQSSATSEAMMHTKRLQHPAFPGFGTTDPNGRNVGQTPDVLLDGVTVGRGRQRAEQGFPAFAEARKRDVQILKQRRSGFLSIIFRNRVSTTTETEQSVWKRTTFSDWIGARARCCYLITLGSLTIP